MRNDDVGVVDQLASKGPEAPVALSAVELTTTDGPSAMDLNISSVPPS